jgi:hypothetical protein
VNGFRKGLIVAVIQMLLVVAVGAKLMIDRARYPDVWVETAPFDPDLPLRGRYVRLLAVVEPGGKFSEQDFFYEPGRLEVRADRLVALPDEDGPVTFTRRSCRGGEDCVALAEPLAFFIPEDVEDPSIRPDDEELWVRVTVPPNGAPRPIELGIKKDGKIEPIRF